jgi:hypothetical protein
MREQLAAVRPGELGELDTRRHSFPGYWGSTPDRSRCRQIDVEPHRSAADEFLHDLARYAYRDWDERAYAVAVAPAPGDTLLVAGEAAVSPAAFVLGLA